LNTHQVYPENSQDQILLKNLLKEAKDKVINEFGKRDVAQLLNYIESVGSEIDVNYNLDSLHIFLSNSTKEIIKSSLPTTNQGVHIANIFDVGPMIEELNKSKHYLIMLLSQSGVHLYEAINDDIIQELKNDDFPFSENRHYNTFPDKGSDSKHLDNLVREFLNKVDKALVKVHHKTDLKCVVISTRDNYSRLQQVADKPKVYLGHAPVDYHKVATHQIVQQSWEIIKDKQNL
jgi:hypothetical protein